jgi:serine/threonine-protein kinase
MEYLEGINLEVLVSEFGPQPPARVVHVVKQIAGALGEAHAMGLIHRDVKPANIILCERGGAPDVAKIVDFGVVKDVGRAEKPSITGADAITGTPLYLAPETLTADGSVDPRSDIYALGAVAYFLLTGTTVFAGGSVFEICSRHLHTAPDPPSARLGRALPRGLEAVVMSCLEKDPGRRPQTAPELSDLLSDSDDVAPWGEGQAHAWWLEHGARVRGLRARARSEPLDLDTPIRLDVDVEEHLRAADRGTRS